MALRPILVVLHQEHSSPGKLGHALKARGYALDIRRPRFGDPLPATLAAHAGAVIFGGPMSANDLDQYIRDEIDWIGVPLAEQAPFLGICLGAQMLVKTLGGSVAPHCDGCAEVGFYPLRPTPEGRDLMEWPDTVYQWHREGFDDLPADARLLARGDLFPNQAFRVGPSAFGIQFHAELTYAMACRWTTHGRARLTLPGTQPRAAHMNGWFRYDPPIRSWLSRFLDLWLAGDRRGHVAKAA